MIRDNQKLYNRLHVLFDGLIVIGSFLLAHYLRFPFAQKYHIPAIEPSGYFDPWIIFARLLIVLVPAYLLSYNFYNLYGPKRSKSRHLELWNIFKANIIGIVIFMGLILITKRFVEYSRYFLTFFFIINTTFEIVFRYSVNTLLKSCRKKGYNIKHVLIVGYSRAAESYMKRILGNPEWGYSIHGILDDNKKPGESYQKIPILGSIENLQHYLTQNDFDEIAITLSLEEYAKLEEIVSICEKSGVHTKFIPDYNNIIPTRPYTEDLYGLPVVNIRKVPLTNTSNKIIKRIIDIIGSIVAIIIFSIPMLMVSLIIKATSKGPLIFCQVRVGLHNKNFKMYKFRSMGTQADEKEKKAWTTINDPRVTPIGKFIRRTSIDELPQFFNVLKGQMSLVGPRPERPFFVEKFKEEIPRYMIKHQVRPGITGWAQVNGFRGDTSIRKRIDHDLYYIENWTLGLDIKILFMTIFKGFINRNAY